jgi:hypothetical protein
MAVEPALAFATVHDPPALEIRVNFGVFAGRQATPAEIDELAKLLLPEVQEVSIVAEERHEISEEVEASLETVRIEVTEEHLPTDGEELQALSDRLVAAAERWAQSCIADRHSEMTNEAVDL